jgi:hypothetical protein
VYFNYWRQSSRLRHGAVTKHVVTSLLFLLLLSDFVDYAEICAQRGTVDYCRIIPVEVCLTSRRVRIFTPSLPLEFSLCVLHQLNYTTSWMELFPAVYYYRQPAAPSVDNTSIFSNVEINRLRKPGKWHSVKPKITYFRTFCGSLRVKYTLIREIWGLIQQTAETWLLQCSICNKISKWKLIHSYHFHSDDRGSNFLRNVRYMH